MVLEKVREKVSGGKDTFRYTINELNGIYRANTESVSKGMGEFLTDDFRSRKTSDTIFIMGSGPSINDLTDEQIEEIRRNDSIGFNFWLAHDLVPTFYCFQHTKYGNGVLYKLFQRKARDYQDVPIIIRGSMLTKDPKYCEKMQMAYLGGSEVYFLNEYPIDSKFTGRIDNLIRYLENLGFLEFGKVSRFTPKLRGTLGLLICFSYQMGYKNIVLCGIDMNDSSHFYDSDDYSEIRKDFALPAPGVSNISTMQDRDYSKNTVSDYVSGLSRFMVERGRSSLFISSTQSALSGVIPAWKPQKGSFKVEDG